MTDFHVLAIMAVKAWVHLASLNLVIGLYISL